ncbi:hypothetical protein SUDANB176_06800 [Streptomyces sp. enrichment culture]|uniref:hypothetical protein n=1 Tax=Streptomyces sp. enrichment culture TaxID=1795815 RepID=UPI003F56E506
MIFGGEGKERFLDAVAGFETAVRERDGDRSTRAFRDIHRYFGSAPDHGIAEGGPRLAALLPEVPAGPRGALAAVAGACAERGADAAVAWWAPPQWETRPPSRC